MPASLTLTKIQHMVDDWIKSIGGGYWPPLSMLAALMEEMGELAREINAREGFKRKKRGEVEIDIGMELADIVFAVVCIANYYGIDLEEYFRRIIEKYTERDFDRWRR